MIRTAGVDIDVHRTTFAWRRRDLSNEKAIRYSCSIAGVSIGWVENCDEGEWDIVQCTTPQNELAILEAVKMVGVELVAVEKPYLGKNVQSYGRLSEVFGRIAGLCDLVGIRWKGTLAEVWQRGMLSQGAYLPDGKGRKDLAMLVAGDLGAKPKNDDCADAACLAEFESKGDLR